MMEIRILPAALLLALLAWPAQAQQRQPANVSTLPQSSPQEFDLLDKTGAWLPFFPGAKDVFVRNYGPHNDWIGDDGPAIAAALNAASAAGGGTVYLDQVSYWNQTQALIVPKGVHLRCVGAFVKRDLLNDYTARPCTIYQKAGTSLRVDGALTGAGLLGDWVHFQPVAGMTRQQWITFTAGWVGTGVQIGDATGANESGSQAVLQNVQIGGFNQCVVQNGADQAQMRQILGDCTNGLDINNSFDNNALSDIEFWGFLSTHAANFSQINWTVTNIADNGSGLWRVTYTTGTAPALATGEKVWMFPGFGQVDGTGPGAAGAAGLWTVTAIDATHIDLQGSVVAPSTTGNTTLDNTYVAVASTADLQIGMNVSGAGIPAGAKIGAVWRSRNAINLDQAHRATATATGVALTFTNDPWTGDGQARLNWNANDRFGTAFAIGRADGTVCSGCYDFGYQVGYNFRDAIFTNFSNSAHDGNVYNTANKNYTPIGIEFTGIAYGNTVQMSALSTAGVHILDTATGSPSNSVQLSSINMLGNNSTVLENPQANLTLFGGNAARGGVILIGSGANTTLVGNNYPYVFLYGQTAQPFFIGSGNLFAGQADFKAPTQALSNRFTSAGPAIAIYDFYNGNAALNEKFWRWNYQFPNFCLQAANDAYTVPISAFCAHRTATTVNDVTYSAPLIASATGQAALFATSTDGASSGGGIKMTNTTAGATTPTKWLRVTLGGVFQMLNSAYTVATMSVDDAGNGQFAQTVATTTAFTIGGTLPTCNGALKGASAYVNNGQASPPYLGAVSTTGAVVAPVFCNGSGWVYH